MDYERISAARERLRATLNKALMKCNPSPLGDEGCDADVALGELVAFERADAALIAFSRVVPSCGDGAGGWCTTLFADAQGYGWCQIHDRRRGAEAELEKLVKATEA